MHEFQSKHLSLPTWNTSQHIHCIGILLYNNKETRKILQHHVLRKLCVQDLTNAFHYRIQQAWLSVLGLLPVFFLLYMNILQCISAHCYILFFTGITGKKKIWLCAYNYCTEYAVSRKLTVSFTLGNLMDFTTLFIVR